MTNTSKNFRELDQKPTIPHKAEIAESIFQKTGKVLLVEGPNDKTFIKRILDEELNYHQQIKIHPLNDYFEKKCGNNSTNKIAQNDKEFYVGGFGRVNAKKAIIITIKRHALEDKNKICSIKTIFYGIVDKDYDENDCDLQKIKFNPNEDREEYKKLNAIDVVKEKKLISTDTNDLETMLFKYDFETIKKICTEKGYSSENTFVADSQFIIDSACKLGYLRKVSHDKELEIDFKKLFHFQSPEDYEKYITNGEYDISRVFSDITNKRKSSIDLSKMPESFDSKEWFYCRGHDLTGILSSYFIFKKYGKGNNNDIIYEPGRSMTRRDVIRNTESILIKEILEKTIIDQYKTSNVFKFLEGVVK